MAQGAVSQQAQGIVARSRQPAADLDGFQGLERRDAGPGVAYTATVDTTLVYADVEVVVMEAHLACDLPQAGPVLAIGQLQVFHVEDDFEVAVVGLVEGKMSPGQGAVEQEAALGDPSRDDGLVQPVHQGGLHDAHWVVAAGMTAVAVMEISLDVHHRGLFPQPFHPEAADGG